MSFFNKIYIVYINIYRYIPIFKYEEKTTFLKKKIMHEMYLEFVLFHFFQKHDAVNDTTPWKCFSCWIIFCCCLFPFQPLVYFPHMCNMNTEAMNIKLITRTGTGPLKKKKNQNYFLIPFKRLGGQQINHPIYIISFFGNYVLSHTVLFGKKKKFHLYWL